jgi:hypothetical protein
MIVTSPNINTSFLVNSETRQVFLQSSAINVFPCSRRGQSSISSIVTHFDPEARLNTERTNRLGVATNGFTDSFIKSYTINTSANTATLVFALCGYHIEIKNFVPRDIASNLSTTATSIYAHLRLHTGIPLNTEDYYTEILYRQADTSGSNPNSLDIGYGDGKTRFFVGVSFTDNKIETPITNTQYHNLLLFNKVGNNWELAQTSLLPKIEHDVLEDSVLVGELHVQKNLQADADVHIDGTVSVPSVDEAGNSTTITRPATLTAKHISVPYSGTVEGFPNTEIKNTGITTAYVRAGDIKSGGLAVGNTITIVDDKDRDNNSNVDEALTTIGKGYVTAKDQISVPEVFKAEANSYTLDSDGKIISATEIAKVSIPAKNGLVVSGVTTLNNDLVITDKNPEILTPYLKLDVASVQKNLTVNVPSKLTSSLEVDGTVEFNNDVTVQSTIKTPTLKVDTIENYSATGITITPDITAEGALTVAEAATFNGITTLNNSLAVTNGNNKDLLNLNAQDTEPILTIKVPTNINNNLEVTNNTKIGGTLEVTGDTTIKGVTTFNNNLEVTAGAEHATSVLKLDVTNEDKNLAVNVPVQFTNDLNVTGSTELAGKLSAQSGVSVGGGLTVATGDVRISAGDLVVENSLSADYANLEGAKIGDLETTNSISTPSLTVANITANATSGKVTVEAANVEITGQTTLQNGLTVSSGNTSLGADLQVSSNISANGNLTVTGYTTLEALSAGTADLDSLSVDGTIYTDIISAPHATITELEVGTAILEGDLTVNGNILVEGDSRIDARFIGAEEVTAAQIIQNGQPVPAISVTPIEANVYKLSIKINTAAGTYDCPNCGNTYRTAAEMRACDNSADCPGASGTAGHWCSSCNNGWLAYGVTRCPVCLAYAAVSCSICGKPATAGLDGLCSECYSDSH